MSGENWESDWEEYVLRARARMRKGHEEYGGKSYSLELDALLDELQQEMLDVAGWASVGYARVKRMREALADYRARATAIDVEAEEE